MNPNMNLGQLVTYTAGGVVIATDRLDYIEDMFLLT